MLSTDDYDCKYIYSKTMLNRKYDVQRTLTTSEINNNFSFPLTF